ncbi:MAG TPA: PAS domain-containing protein, partial [Candidatus Didemnitutus sp.]|nr:PAS domain-containing protein [Candidatus Didemnitutus sp.]
MLTSRQAIWIGWGPELVFLYNDAYLPIIGGRHPQAMGQPTREVWREIWSIIAPMLSTAMTGDEGTYVESMRLIMERNGYREETYYTFSYSPVPDDDGEVGGIICANTDDTQRSIGERQLTLLREISGRAASARSWQDACERACTALVTNPRDIPFALIYLSECEGGSLRLAGLCGIDGRHPAAHPGGDFSTPCPWPLEKAARREITVVPDLAKRFSEPLPTGAWSEPPTQAALVPLSIAGRSGLLVAALNPFRLFDENYQNFLRIVGGQIAASVG